MSPEGRESQWRLYERIRYRDIDGAYEQYLSLQKHGEKHDGMFEFYDSFLSICTKGEHLSYVNKVFEDMHRDGAPITLVYYLCKIRCHADLGQLDEAYGGIDSCIEHGMDIKLRMYQPILDYAQKKSDLNVMLTAFEAILNRGLIPRSEQLAMLLRCAFQSGDLALPGHLEKVNDIMEVTRSTNFGIEGAEMPSIVRAATGKTLQEIYDEGILVESIELVPGKIIIDKSSVDGTVVAVCGTWSSGIETCNPDREALEMKRLEAGDDCWIENAENTISAELTVDKFSLRGPVDEENKNFGEFGRRIDKHSSIEESQPPSRLVDISPSGSGCCPNCGEKMQYVPPTAKEKLKVRQALLEVISDEAINAEVAERVKRDMGRFQNWLRYRDFKYIVDAANVGYSSQNFDAGKFSFKQVKIIVEALRKRGDGNVLVLLPWGYNHYGRVPNRVSQSNEHFSVLTPAEKDILKWLWDEEMVYKTPRGCNDDWYWLLASAAGGIASESYVVTNDMMRDHKLAFLEPRAFMNWRAGHVSCATSFSFEISHALYTYRGEFR
jgi:hypothetical protein